MLTDFACADRGAAARYRRGSVSASVVNAAECQGSAAGPRDSSARAVEKAGGHRCNRRPSPRICRQDDRRSRFRAGTAQHKAQHCLTRQGETAFPRSAPTTRPSPPPGTSKQGLILLRSAARSAFAQVAAANKLKDVDTLAASAAKEEAQRRAQETQGHSTLLHDSLRQAAADTAPASAQGKAPIAPIAPAAGPKLTKPWPASAPGPASGESASGAAPPGGKAAAGPRPRHEAPQQRGDRRARGAESVAAAGRQWRQRATAAAPGAAPGAAAARTGAGSGGHLAEAQARRGHAGERGLGIPPYTQVLQGVAGSGTDRRQLSVAVAGLDAERGEAAAVV
jgi:hypothetical protein